jgi:hypothetical protein
MGLASVPSGETMADDALVTRVEILETKMELLENLPDRVSAVELQIVHLRSEMHEQSLVVRKALRTEIRVGDEETRRYMRVLHEEVLSRIATIQESRPRRKR